MTLMIFGQMTKPAALGALALTAFLMQGCEQPQMAAAGSRQYAVDQSGGAKVCNAPKVSPANGQVTDVAMTMTNDGGWCGALVSLGGRPFAAGPLTARPKIGKVYVHTVGDVTRIDYTPEKGFAGNDSFTVKLVPGDGSVRVNVAVAK
jgi:hypothetical protein